MGHEGDHGKGDDGERDEPGFSVIRARSHSGAEPPGVGSRVMASPSQMNDMPRVTTMDGSRRTWMQGPDGSVGHDATDQGQHPEEGLVYEQRRGDARGQADVGADRQVQVVDGHDEQLGKGRQRQRHGQPEEQVEPEVARRLGLHVKDGEQHDEQ